jgi:hypothetical protein
MADTSGGNFGAHGRILINVSVRGRFEATDRGSGTVRASAIVTRDEFAPSVACSTGPLGWTASR